MRKSEAAYCFRYAIAIAGLLAASQVGMAQGLRQAAAPNIKSEEYVIYGDVNMGGGETEIAVDPTDPNHIIIGILAGHHRLADGKIPDGTLTTRAQRLAQNLYSYCVFAQTWDRGATWTYFEDHTDKKIDPTKSNNYDPALQFAPDGTLYRALVFGMSAIMSSKDKGKTWSEPQIMQKPPGPWDRAEIRVDYSTGAIYVDGHMRAGTPPVEIDSVAASHDGGKTWSPGQIWDSGSSEYPQLASNGAVGMAAGNGRVAVAYISGKPGGTPPRIVFGTSKDDGKTFDRHVVPHTGPLKMVTLAADQPVPGRYAVMTMSQDASQLWVYVTEDYGNTWSKAIAARAPAGTKLFLEEQATGNQMIDNDHVLSAMTYSRKGGQLAILWRAQYPDHSFDVWSSFSKDGGKTFKSLRVNHATSPRKSKERGHFLVGEDYWGLDIDSESVHFVYTGSQPGFLATWYGRMPISAY